MLRMGQRFPLFPFFPWDKNSISLSIIKSHGNNRNNGKAPHGWSKNFRYFRYFRGTKLSIRMR